MTQAPLWSFSLFGFRVRVEGGFLFVLLILAMLSPRQLQEPLYLLLMVPTVFVAILVHELGHAFTIRSFRLPVGDIVLHGMGGQVSHPVTTAPRQLAISLAGPGAGLLLGGLLYGLTAVVQVPAFLVPIASLALFVTIGWSVFNLLPLLPMDGGQALRAGLAMVMSARNATRIAAVATMALAALGAIFSVQAGEWFLAFLALYFGYRGFAIYQEVA